MNFTGRAQRITAGDIEDAAQRLGCEVAALRAVMAVESRNSGYDANRRPIILFEPHVFYRVLPPRKLQGAIDAGLAYKRWGTRPYPRTSDGNYARLSAAIDIDEECAFRAVSIGLGQILGENYKLAGCASAKEMFARACDSEGEQLEQMASFIEESKLTDALRNRDWRKFARVYNGPGKVDAYASDLAAAYAKWRRVTDKPRDEITAHDLRAAGSRTIQGTDSVKSGLTGVAIAGTAAETISQISDTASQASSAVQSATEAAHSGISALAWVEAHWEHAALALSLALLAYFAWRIWRGASVAADARVDDARSGLNARI